MSLSKPKKLAQQYWEEILTTKSVHALKHKSEVRSSILALSQVEKAEVLDYFAEKCRGHSMQEPTSPHGGSLRLYMMIWSIRKELSGPKVKYAVHRHTEAFQFLAKKCSGTAKKKRKKTE